MSQSLREAVAKWLWEDKVSPDKAVFRWEGLNTHMKENMLKKADSLLYLLSQHGWEKS